MSNPGYPYPQGSGSKSGSPYPAYPPQNPQNSALYPTQNRVFAPSLGFNVGSPMYMPQPYAGMGYPSSTLGTSHNFSYPQSSNYGQTYPYPQNHYSNNETQASPYPSYPQSSPYPKMQSYKPANSDGHGYSGYCHTSHAQKRSPTVVPAQNFNPRDDAEVLRKAMKGFGTDEKAIINVLTKRSNAQRLEIAVQFKSLYGKDLIKDLKSELSGNFEKTIIALMTPLPQYYAKELHDAISGLGTDETVLIEVLCSLSNAEIYTIREAYQLAYGRSLESDLKGDTSGHFKRLMVSLCNGGRDESFVTNPVAAAADAQALYEAGEQQWGTDESTFNMVLCQRNHEQLRLIFEKYQQLTNHDLETAIKSEFSGDIKDGLLAVIRFIKNRPAFFAKCLYKSMKGLGTNDRDLIRLVVTRCEIDMGEIKQAYAVNHGECLADAIKGDTSGHYKKCLLALIGES